MVRRQEIGAGRGMALIALCPCPCLIGSGMAPSATREVVRQSAALTQIKAAQLAPMRFVLGLKSSNGQVFRGRGS